MDYITRKDSNKYVISLDSLDMGLLPTFTARPDSSTSPWTANLNIGTKDYFEFHVKSKTESDIFDDDDDAKMNNESTNSMNESQTNLSKSTHREEIITICHICDIDIPAAYLTDHENSLKHKANLKITDAVLSRTRKHILKKSNGYVRKNYSNYFCGPCASEVKLHDKHTHENSKTHKRSASLDRLLFELVTLYTIHEYEDLSTSKTMNDENFIKNEFDSEIEDNTVVVSDIEARLEEYEAKTAIDYTQLAHEFGLDTLYALSNVGNDIKISRVNGSEVIVSEDNFNGFIQTGKDHKFCILCKIIVEEEKVHKLSDAHLESITEPFNDDNFIRNLGDSRSHCVICNKIVNGTNFHITCDKTHKDLLQQALAFNKNEPKVVQKDPIINVNDQETRPDTGIINNGLDKGLDNRYRLLQSIITPIPKPNVTPKSDIYTKINNDTYLCNPCNLELHVNNIESHEIGTKHAMNLKSAVHYNMVRNLGSVNLTCRVCNSSVADNVDKVKAHVATNDHVRKYTDLLANNRVIVKDGNFYCEPCDLVILKRNELIHIEKPIHETNLSFQTLKVKLNSTQNPKTRKADSNAPCQVDNGSDKRNVSNTNQPSNNEPKRTDTTAYFCDVCKVKVPNNPNNIRSHNEGGKHKQNACKLLNTVEEVVDSIDDSESLEVHCHMDASDNEKCLMCKVCKVLVPNMEDGINEHVKGKKHDAAFKVIMDSNHIESVNDKYFCKLCKVDIKTNNIFKHINQKKHVALVVREAAPETANPVETSEFDAKDKVADDISDPLSKESVDVLYQKFKHNFVESEDKERLKCKICSDVDIVNTVKSVVNHSRLKVHREGYKKLLNSNLIFQTEDGKYLCAVCDCYVPRTGEINHVLGSRHIGNFAVVVSKEKCIVCDMTDTNMSEHITTREHVYNVLCNEPLLHFCKYCKLLIKKDYDLQHKNSCHRFAVRDKICFCAECHPFLPKTSSS